MPFLATTSILMSYGLLVTYFKLKQINILDKYFRLLVNNKFYKLLFLVPIIITTTGIETKKSFGKEIARTFISLVKKYKNILQLKKKYYMRIQFLMPGV